MEFKIKFIPETKCDTQKVKQERNKVVCNTITNVQKKRLPLDVNTNFRSFPFENSSYISNNASYIKPIPDFVVSKEISNYLEIRPSSEDCLNDVFDDKNSYDTELRGRWNRKLVLRHGEPENYPPTKIDLPKKRNDDTILESCKTEGGGSLYDVDIPNQYLNNNLDEAGLGINHFLSF